MKKFKIAVMTFAVTCLFVPAFAAAIPEIAHAGNARTFSNVAGGASPQSPWARQGRMGAINTGRSAMRVTLFNSNAANTQHQFRSHFSVNINGGAQLPASIRNSWSTALGGNAQGQARFQAQATRAPGSTANISGTVSVFNR